MADASPDAPLTELLQAWQGGDGQAFAELIRASHAQLQRMAADRMRHGGPLTLTPQEVLHEAVASLLERPAPLRSRAHFFATMSLKMRAIIVDHARARVADKRGGHAVQVTLNEASAGSEGDVFDLLALDEALQRLALEDRRGSEILHLSYFAGLEQAEIAQLLGISLRTVEREMRFLRAWLQEQLRG